MEARSRSFSAASNGSRYEQPTSDNRKLPKRSGARNHWIRSFHICHASDLRHKKDSDSSRSSLYDLSGLFYKSATTKFQNRKKQ